MLWVYWQSHSNYLFVNSVSCYYYIFYVIFTLKLSAGLSCKPQVQDMPRQTTVPNIGLTLWYMGAFITLLSPYKVTIMTSQTYYIEL